MIAIATASVPIVKFEDPSTGLHIDLNCNEQLGLINTILLNNYCEAWAPLRKMIFFLKKWAKSLGLNDPSGTAGPSSFSSYCIALMAVGFLQVGSTCTQPDDFPPLKSSLQSQGVLPNLQSNLPDVDREKSGFWMRSKPKKGDTRLWCDTRFGSPENWKGVEMSLEDAMCGWFR